MRERTKAKTSRHVLHLVKNGRRPHCIEEPLRIGPQARDDVRVFEQEVARFGKEVPEQKSLPGPATPTRRQEGF